MRRLLSAPDDIAGEVAIVTGASRGLGLELARELARQSCPMVICARDEAELNRAAADLRALGAELVTIPCDITSETAPQLLVETALRKFGRLDIVVNNAGIIQVGPVSATTYDDYESAIRVMALAPLRMVLAALPVLRKQGHGRIVNITSVGGKVSVPHLLPYSMGKFAAVALSEGLRAELGPRPVTVTTAVPGLMRTGSHVQAMFTGQQDKEFTWFALGASLPLVSMDAAGQPGESSPRCAGNAAKSSSLLLRSWPRGARTYSQGPPPRSCTPCLRCCQTRTGGHTTLNRARTCTPPLTESYSPPSPGSAGRPRAD